MNLYPAAVAFDNALADGQAQAGTWLTIGPMAVEGIEYAVQTVLCNTQAVINDLDYGLIVLNEGSHDQAPTLWHRVVSILYQVEHQHPQVTIIRQDTRLGVIELKLLRDAMATGIEIEQRDGIEHRRIQRHDLCLLLRQTGEQQQTLGHAGATVDFVTHHVEIASHPLRRIIAAAQAAQ